MNNYQLKVKFELCAFSLFLGLVIKSHNSEILPESEFRYTKYDAVIGLHLSE